MNNFGLPIRKQRQRRWGEVLCITAIDFGAAVRVVSDQVMEVIPKYPPRRSCGLKLRARLRVLRDFQTLNDSKFSVGEELIFLREMWDRDMGMDVYVFGSSESDRIERGLPEGGIVNGQFLWHELVRHKHVYGEFGFEDPHSWLTNFEAIA